MKTIFAFGKERKVRVNSRGYETFWNPLTRDNYYVHRFVYEQAYGSIIEGMSIHHIDENKLNNSLDNLEIISHGDHRRLHNWGNKWGKINYKGGSVSWSKARQKWRAFICKNGKRKALGSFPTQFEAYQALFNNDPGYWTRQKQLEVKL